MEHRGHNNPPELLELSEEVITSISDFMSQTPVVETHSAAVDMKVQVDRAKICLKDLEDERDNKVRPLNDQVSAINLTYRKPKSLLTDLLSEMLGRVHRYITAEEAKRAAIAAEKARLALEAEEAALEAERLEQERLDDASQGEVGVNVAQVIEHADVAFEQAQRAKREAILAQRDTRVKIRGLGRATGTRDKEIIDVIDASAALMEMGVNDSIKIEIVRAARAYRKLHNRLPKGIHSTFIEVLQ